MITITTITTDILDAVGNPANGTVTIRPNASWRYDDGAGGTDQVSPLAVNITITNGKVSNPVPLALAPTVNGGVSVNDAAYIVTYILAGVPTFTETWRIDANGPASIEWGVIQVLDTSLTTPALPTPGPKGDQGNQGIQGIQGPVGDLSANKGIIRNVTTPLARFDCSGIVLQPFNSGGISIGAITDVANYAGLLRTCVITSQAAIIQGLTAGMFATIGGVDYNIISVTGFSITIEWDSKLKADPTATTTIYSTWKLKGQHVGGTTFTRGSRRYYIHATTGEHHMMPAGFPCFERDPESGKVALSIDGSLTEYFINSQKATTFNNGVYTRTDNTVVAPDGTTTGGTITANAASTFNLKAISIGSDIDGRTFTISVWIKANVPADVGLSAQLWIYRTDITDIKAIILPITADWVRHSFTKTFSAATGKGHTLFNFRIDSRSTLSVAGEALDIWQMNVKEFAKVTTDTKTFGTTITTLGDDAKVEVLGNRLRSSDDFTIAIEFSAQDIALSNRNAHVLNFGTGENHLLMRCGSTLTGESIFNGNNNNLDGTGFADNTSYRWVFRHKSLAIESWRNGILHSSGVNSSATVGTPVYKMLIGGWTVPDLFGHVRSIEFYDTALTDAEIAA